MDAGRTGARAAMRLLKENAAAMVKLLDTDKNGKLSSDEFKRRTLFIFDRLDANKDGTVTGEERRKAVTTAGR